MSTATASAHEIISNILTPAQNETTPSDVEILRRVRKIRSSWSVSERIERRQAANERFANLIETLELDSHAA